MKKLHEKLMKNRWYSNWHQNPHHSAIHTLILILCVATMATFVVSSSSVTAQAAERPHLGISLASAVKEQQGLAGDDAIKGLGQNISAVARAYGKTVSELKHAFQHDKALRVDKEGLLFYSETELPDPQKASLGDGTIPNNPTTVEIPDALTFKLHSKPSQSAKIWLNFQGATTQGTSWNYNGPIVSAPFSMDSDPSFSSAEMDVIKAVWRSVAEDYAPFDVDVTTEPSANYNYDTGHFMQVIISPTYEWFGQSGGVSYVSSFTWGDGTPAFVFSSLLGNNPKYIAEATAHEAGHTVGLYHTSSYDTLCNYAQEYSYGYGNNPGWGPIMGAGYYIGVSQWTKSSEWPYLASPFGCHSEQDDLSVMTSALTLSADDIGNTASNAGALSKTIGSDGIAYVDQLALQSQNDIDMYKFSTVGGDIKLNVKPVAPYGALMGDADFRVRLLDANMNVLAESNPTAIGTAYVEKIDAASGTYYVEVSASGYLDLSQPGGYSTYGSMGQYQVVGTYVATSASPDTMAPTVSITNPAAGATLSGITSIAANATDNIGVDHVDFYRGTTLIGADSTAPYSISWDTTAVANGTYSLAAKAYDAAQNVATSADVSVTVSNSITPPPDTTAPTVSVASPAAGATVSGFTTLTAAATDNVAVTKVSFFDGATLIDTDTTASPDYSIAWDTTKVSNGNHTITAKAYDAAGNIGTSSPVAVYVSNTTPSIVVTITSPKDGSVITAGKGGTVTVSASAATTTKTTMTLYIDGLNVYSVLKNTMSYKWNIKNLTSGPHTIRVTASDAKNAVGEKTITVTK